MNKFEDKFFSSIAVIWIIGAVLSLGVTGVAIWGVISLVNWITSQNF